MVSALSDFFGGLIFFSGSVVATPPHAARSRMKVERHSRPPPAAARARRGAPRGVPHAHVYGANSGRGAGPAESTGGAAGGAVGVRVRVGCVGVDAPLRFKCGWMYRIQARSGRRTGPTVPVALNTLWSRRPRFLARFLKPPDVAQPQSTGLFWPRRKKKPRR
jgi:hypothetical protein